MGRPKGSTKKKLIDALLADDSAQGAGAAVPESPTDEFAGAFPNGKVVVWERVRDRPDALIGTFEADGDVINRVATAVGGGDFVWRLRLPTGLWASKEKDGVTGLGKFSISERAFPKKTPGAPAIAPPAGERALDIQALFMAQMQQTTALLTALVGRPQKESDPIALLSAFKALMPAPAPPANALESAAAAMDLIKNAQEMFPTGGGGGGGKKMEDRIFSLLEAVGPEVVKRVLTPSQPAPILTHRAPAPAPVVPELPEIPQMVEDISENPPAPESEVSEMDLKKIARYAMLAPYIGKLAGLAARGADSTTYADVFLDEIEERKIPVDELLEFFGNEKLIVELSDRFAQVKANAEWFESFRLAVVEMLTEPGAGDTLSGDVAPANAPKNTDA